MARLICRSPDVDKTCAVIRVKFAYFAERHGLKIHIRSDARKCNAKCNVKYTNLRVDAESSSGQIESHISRISIVSKTYMNLNEFRYSHADIRADLMDLRVLTYGFVRSLVLINFLHPSVMDGVVYSRYLL